MKQEKEGGEMMKNIVEEALREQKRRVFLDFDKLMPNADNTNPCMKCGAQQCARCGYELINEFHKLKKKWGVLKMGEKDESKGS